MSGEHVKVETSWCFFFSYSSPHVWHHGPLVFFLRTPTDNATPPSCALARVTSPSLTGKRLRSIGAYGQLVQVVRPDSEVMRETLIWCKAAITNGFLLTCSADLMNALQSETAADTWPWSSSQSLLESCLMLISLNHFFFYKPLKEYYILFFKMSTTVWQSSWADSHPINAYCMLVKSVIYPFSTHKSQNFASVPKYLSGVKRQRTYHSTKYMSF